MTDIERTGPLRVSGNLRARPLSSRTALSSDSRVAEALRGEGGGATSAKRDASDALIRNAQGRLDIAAQAAEEIASIRSKQQELARRASEDTVSGRMFTSLQDEYDTLETEVNRIASNATFNGQNVFSTETQSIVTTKLDFSSAVSTPSISGVTATPGVTIGEVEDAATGYTRAKRLTQTARVFAGDQTSRSNQANRFLENRGPPPAEEEIQSTKESASARALQEALNAAESAIREVAASGGELRRRNDETIITPSTDET